jgi:hypothetical protein
MFIVNPPWSRTTMNRAGESLPTFTQRQVQYLAFIHAYTLVNGRPPAQADMQRFFRVTPPTVHQMLLTLERAGLISRQPGMVRCVTVLVGRDHLPRLDSRRGSNRQILWDEVLGLIDPSQLGGTSWLTPARGDDSCSAESARRSHLALFGDDRDSPNDSRV